MANPFTRKQGDTLDSMRFQCLDDSGPVDLSVTIASELRMNPDNQLSSAVILGSVIPDNPASTAPNTGLGWWQYNWKNGDPDIPGNYGIEVTFTYPDGNKRTFPTVGQYPVLITPRST